MKSMFFKLFLGFWLTMILGGAVSFVVLSTFQHFSLESMRVDFVKKFDNNLSKLMVLSGQAAWDMYRCGGRADYEHYVNGLAAGARTRINLVREDNRSLTGDRVSDVIVRMAEAARKTTGSVIHKSGDTLSVARKITSKDGNSIVVVAVHAFGPAPGLPPPPDGPRGRFRGHPRDRLFPPFFGRGDIVRTAIMLIVVSLVCYLLARSLTGPIRKLQKTTQQIAQGDYSARVGGSLGRAGSEITDLGRDFDVMVERTENLINARKRLLRDISHELRSPLARLNVALELAKKRFDADDDQALARIDKESLRLNELIGHLLVVARLEGGAGIETLERIDLRELVLEVVEDAKFEATGSGRGVSIVAMQEVTVSGSGELLRRAFENIVRNAVQYTAPDTRVEVSLTVEGSAARLVVADYGPGVPEQDLPHLFEPFYRVAKARERESGGVGIGLAIAYQAVKVHHGSVTAANAKDRQGLVVTVALPVET